jgi:flagellar basal-body rod modification protein FlgD
MSFIDLFLPSSTASMPRALDSSSGTPKSSGSSASSPAPSNQLDANSFITLLTAQLQAQDPLNPLDPSQMVSELTSMNTLQQIIQIRQDLDSLLQTSQAIANPTAARAAGANAISTLSAASNPAAIAHNAALAATKFALAKASFKL